MATKLDYAKIQKDSMESMKLDEKSYKIRLAQSVLKPAITGKKSNTLNEGDVFELPQATAENYEGEMPKGFILASYEGHDFCYCICNRLGGAEYRVASGRFSREPRKVGDDGKAKWNKESREYETYPLEGSFAHLYRHFASTCEFLMPTLYECARFLETNGLAIRVGVPHDVPTPYGPDTIYPLDVVMGTDVMSNDDVNALLA